MQRNEGKRVSEQGLPGGKTVEVDGIRTRESVQQAGLKKIMI